MLEPERAKETIQVLLQEPVDCAAPCFWGIMPGKTSLAEARNIFARLRLYPQFTRAEGNRKFYAVDYDFESGLSVDIILTIQDNIVENLRIIILPEEKKAGIPRGWLAYSPETLIARYGEPSRVVFAVDWGPRSYFEMDMYFDTVDLIVVYSGDDIIPRQKGSPQICPLTAQFNIVRLWIGEDPVSPPSDAVPLEEATNMTMDEFSKLMTGDQNKACFIVKGDVFPWSGNESLPRFANPTSNYGSATTLQVDNSPVKHFLLKFDVTGINEQSFINNYSPGAQKSKCWQVTPED